MAGSQKTEASELATKYTLDPVAVQEVRWGNNSRDAAHHYTFLYGNGNANHHLRIFLYVRETDHQLKG
jgi:hypothetical protein